MNKLPSRSDEIYKEIESFEDYELSQCVAYEMAIRNEDNLKVIDDIVDLYLNNNEKLNEKIYNNRLFSLIKISEIIPFISIEHLLHYHEQDEERLSYFLNNFNCYRDKRINKIIYKIIEKDCIEHNTETYHNCKTNNVAIIEDDLLDTNTLQKKLIRNGYILETSITESAEHAYIILDDENSKKLENEEDWKEYMKYGGEHIFATHKITENFKRPKLKTFSNMFKKYPTLGINLSKPLNELIAYITHIKKDLEENQDILKAPIELLGEEIQKADNLVCNEKGKCFDSRKILSKQQKIADMFYVYDMVKADINQRKIHNIVKNEIYNYYADNEIYTKAMDRATFTKYKELATDYIDNNRYQELVTGISIPNL